MKGFTTHYDFFLYPNNTVGMALKTRINIQSDMLSGIVWKMGCKTSQYMTTRSNNIDDKTANTKYMFLNGFLTKMDSSLRQSNTWMSWATTNVVKANVLAYVNCSISFWKAMIKAANDTIPINRPRLTILKPNPRANIPSLGSLGLCCITSFSGLSSPSAIAGNPSVTRLTHRIWTGTSGNG